MKNTLPLLALLAMSSSAAFADVRYTNVMAMNMGGTTKPMNTTVTWMRDGQMRTDTAQEIGAYKSSETSISTCARNERVTLDPSLKLYTIEPLKTAIASADGSAKATTLAKPVAANTKTETGKVVMTVGAQFVGTEKIADRDTRHYKTSSAINTSGCCGTMNTSSKSEIWVADVKLPTFDCGTGNGDMAGAWAAGKPNCVPTVERKGDVAAFDAAHRGLIMKQILFNPQDGKPMMTTTLSMISFAKLGDTDFAVPAGFKKVTRAEYDKARQAAMMAGMMGGAAASPAAPATTPQAAKNTRTEDDDEDADAPNVVEEVVKETAKNKAKNKLRNKLRLPF